MNCYRQSNGPWIPIILMAVGLFAFALKQYQSNVAPSPVTIEDDDAQVNAAMQEARDTFDQFLTMLRDPIPGCDEFAIKIPISHGEITEHIWVDNIYESEEGLLGNVASEPRYVKSVEYGQPIVVDVENISDWVYWHGNRRIGAYTQKVIEARSVYQY